MNDIIGVIVGIPLFILVVFLAFVYFPAFISKTTNINIRTRGVVNTTYKTEDFDNINHAIKEKASDLYKSTVLNEYQKVMFEINKRLTSSSSIESRYSDYLKLNQRYKQLSQELSSLGGDNKEVVERYLKAQFFRQHFGKEPTHAIDLSGRNDRTTSRRVPELIEVSRIVSKMDSFFKGVTVDAYINFFNAIVPLRTQDERTAFLDSINCYNFKPMEEIIIDINTKQSHNKLSEEHVNKLRLHILSMYFPNYQTDRKWVN
jgi:hypothetical protein